MVFLRLAGPVLPTSQPSFCVNLPESDRFNNLQAIDRLTFSLRSSTAFCAVQVGFLQKVERCCVAPSRGWQQLLGCPSRWSRCIRSPSA